MEKCKGQIYHSKRIKAENEKSSREHDLQVDGERYQALFGTIPHDEAIKIVKAGIEALKYIRRTNPRDGDDAILRCTLAVIANR